MSQRRFLLYAPQQGREMTAELGKSDYSYWFVLRYFEPMLRGLGDVVVLPDLPDPADIGADDVLLLFMPPHRIPLDLAPAAIPVFAWEYSTIPTEAWAGDGRNDWREVLSRARGAITHSRFAVQTVLDALGPDYPVVALPAPVWDRFSALSGQHRATPWSMDFTGVMIDSHAAGLDRDFGTAMPDIQQQNHHLRVDGIVYTTVANPGDGRKVWEDTATAFVWAHRDNPRATLIMKLVHFDAPSACAVVWALIRRLGPFACRIVVIHAYLHQEEFEHLVTGTTYIVNTSRGEGQCLPLMEFMSAGVPAIAPDHTAMAEYVNADDAFPLAWSPQWTHWPHDPRRFMRCETYPVDWGSAKAAFEASAQVAGNPARYAQMRESATRSLERFCSTTVVAEDMSTFLDRICAAGVAEG